MAHPGRRRRAAPRGRRRGHARAPAAANVAQARDTTEFRDWLAAREATDAAWGQWALVMDSKPHA